MRFFAEVFDCKSSRPTMREVLGRIAALPAPVVGARVLEFTAGFFDNTESEAVGPAFVELVGAQAVAPVTSTGA